MKDFLQKLTLKNKIRFGFGVILVVLVIITIQAVINLAVVRVNIQGMVEINQPVAIQATRMELKLEDAMTSLSLYLLTDDKDFLANYEEGVLKAKESLLFLQTNALENDLLGLQNLNTLSGLFNQLLPLMEKVTFLHDSADRVYFEPDLVKNNIWPVAEKIESRIALSLRAEMGRINSDSKEVVRSLLSLQEKWFRLNFGLKSYLVTGSESIANEIGLYLNEFESFMLEISRKELENSLLEEDIVQIQNLYEVYRENFMTLRASSGLAESNVDVKLMNEEIVPLFDEIKQHLEVISAEAVDGMMKVSLGVVDSSFRNLILLLSLSVIGLLIGVGITRKVVRSVVEPVQDLAKAMKNIAQGDGDLTKRLKLVGKDELTEFSQSFNDFVEKIQTTLKEVSLRVDSLEEASKDLLQVTIGTKSGIEKQLVASEKLSGSMVDMANQAKKIEDHSHNTTGATDQAASRVREGGEVVEGAACNIRLVSSGMEDIAKSVMLLSEDSKTISSVTNVIREISDQTNLLALNAAIEAARAGEHGRGFAVVADEVRKLAQRTQESTVKIEEVISKIQRATKETVKVVEAGQVTTQEGYKSVMAAQKMLMPVVILIDDVNKMSEQMLLSAQSQTSLTKEVNDNLNQIHRVSEQAVKGATETEKASYRLQTIADDLEDLVHKFKI